MMLESTEQMHEATQRTRLRRAVGRLPVHVWGYAALLALALLFPLVAQRSGYLQTLGILMLLTAYQGCAWNILGGFTGQFSFGHAAFFGIGAYTSTVLFIKLGLTPWLGMIGGGLLAAAVGAFFGYLTFRYQVRGHYFALAMFAFAEMIRFTVQNLPALNKSVGFLVPLVPGATHLFQFENRLTYYYVILAMVVLIVAVSSLVRYGRWGYFWAALRDDEAAAEMAGVDTLRYKVVAMALSAFFMATAGTFYAQYVYVITPGDTLGITKSLEGLFRAVIGGLGHPIGPILGALVLTPLGEFARSLLPNSEGVDLILFGVLLILFVRFMPSGVYGLVQSAYRKLRRDTTHVA
jgi:branched-chain amino acid transport system permease protein